MNYSYYFKYRYQSVAELASLPQYDLFISSFVNTQRVIEPADVIKASRKLWFVEEKQQQELFLSGKEFVCVKTNDDYDVIFNLFRDSQLVGKKICIDATGF